LIECQFRVHVANDNSMSINTLYKISKASHTSAYWAVQVRLSNNASETIYLVAMQAAGQMPRVSALNYLVSIHRERP